jgi:hypothetical protein
MLEESSHFSLTNLAAPNDHTQPIFEIDGDRVKIHRKFSYERFFTTT